MSYVTLLYLCFFGVAGTHVPHIYIYIYIYYIYIYIYILFYYTTDIFSYLYVHALQSLAFSFVTYIQLLILPICIAAKKTITNLFPFLLISASTLF